MANDFSFVKMVEVRATKEKIIPICELYKSGILPRGLLIKYWSKHLLLDPKGQLGAQGATARALHATLTHPRIDPAPREQAAPTRPENAKFRQLSCTAPTQALTPGSVIVRESCSQGVLESTMSYFYTSAMVHTYLPTYRLTTPLY